MALVTLIDCGIGNLLSVARAFEYCGANVVLSDSATEIANADYLVLPGVGAFADGMAGLRERGLVEPVKLFVSTGRPFLGICLGMQMMMDGSEEFGVHKGLGLIPGSAVAIPPIGTNGVLHKIPHIGWNEIYSHKSNSWNNTILHETPSETSFYFVHSYSVVPMKFEHRLADCAYNGQPIAAVIRNNNAYGCQFHPEKSGKSGLKIISTFLNLSSSG